MKILVIPDIHGNWKDALNNIKAHKDEVSKVVCLGDYVDDFDKSLNGTVMIDGFNELCEMAREEPKKFNLVLGNHDCSYLSETRNGNNCSGHNWIFHDEYHKMFADNIDLLHPVVEIDGVLFSHGGVSMEWYNNLIDVYNVKMRWYNLSDEDKKKEKDAIYKIDHMYELFFDGIIHNMHQNSEGFKKQQDFQHKLTQELYRIQDENYQKSLDVFKDKKFSVKRIEKIFRSPYIEGAVAYNKSVLSGVEYFNHCGWDNAGDSYEESCLWIRPNSLLSIKWPKCKCQVVGHTELGLKFLEHNDKKLVVADSREHNLYYILDTKKIDELDFINV